MIIYNKNVVVVGIIISLLLLVLGVGVYYFNAKPVAQNNQPEITSEDQIQITAENSEGDLAPSDENPLFSICVDQCGDGICQSVVETCEDGGLNCTCLETKNDCSQDCK